MSLAAAALLAAGSVAAQDMRPLLISGYDDVLRQANNTSLARAAIRTMSKDETYAGMPELYRILAADASGQPALFIVSATSSGFEDRALRFLREEKYPEAELYFRDWIAQASSRKFKVAKITDLLNAYPDRKFIAVFDNSDASIELAKTLHRQTPDRFAAIYLRGTVERISPTGTIGFITAFEIAARELQAGRMTGEHVALVAHAIIDEMADERIVPSYADCPRDFDPCRGIAPSIEQVCGEVRTRVTRVCATRMNDRAE